MEGVGEADGEEGAVRDDRGDSGYAEEEDGGSLMDLISGFAGVKTEPGSEKGDKGKQ